MVKKEEKRTLAISLRRWESVTIGDIEICVNDRRGPSSIRIVIKAPKDVEIRRNKEELKDDNEDK